MKQLPQGVSERDQHPALLLDKVCRWCFGSSQDGLHKSRFYLGACGPVGYVPIQGLWLRAGLDCVRNRHGEKRVGLQAHRVRMSQRGILSGPFTECFQGIVDPKDTQRTDSHHGPVGLAVRVRTTLEAGCDGHAAVERKGVEPKLIGFERGTGIVGSSLGQHPGKQQRHFRVIRRLPGYGIPSAAIDQLPYTVRVVATDFLRQLELDQAAESISGKLAKEAALGAR